MRVELIGDGSSGSLQRISGRVRWEAVDRPDLEVYVAAATDRPLAENADWLLLGSLMAAAREREPRLRVDAPVSPLLVEHLRSAQGVMEHWYGERPVPIEAPTIDASDPRGDRATGLFLSGGVDSTASLFTYAHQIPTGHRDALAYGVNIDMSFSGEEPSDLRPKHRIVLDAIGPVAGSAGVRLLPVATNLRRLGPQHHDAPDWMFRAHGAFYASVANALSPLVSRMVIASTYDYAHLVPWGSHPMLDPLFGSTDVAIDHHNAHLSRYEKLRRIVELGGADAGSRLIVCFHTQDRRSDQLPNCGRCEKCLRTLTALLAAGVDGRGLRTFQERTVSVGQIHSLSRFEDRYQLVSWKELVQPLAAGGWTDLSKAVDAKVRSNTFFEFDRRRLGSTVWRAKRALARPSRTVRNVKRRVIRDHPRKMPVPAGGSRG